MKRSSLATLSLLLAWSAAAAPVKIIVNGREIETSVIESNGVIYVPVDALARALGVAVTIQPGEVPAPNVPPTDSPAATATTATPASATTSLAVTEIPPPPPSPVAPTPTTTVVLSSPPPRAPVLQSIKGTLKYNLNILDTRGLDTGAQVWLFPDTQVAALASAAGGTPDEPIPQRAVGWDEKLTEQFKFPHAVADERGEYSFAEIVPGAYTLILLSKHANSLAARDRKGKMRFKRITVAEGQTVEASFNFGMAAYTK